MEKVVVGEKEYVVIKTGRAHASQVLGLTKWIAKHGTKAIKGIQSENIQDENFLVWVAKVVDNLTEDALIDLFTVAIGCEKEESEVYFDISILIEVLVEVYEKQPAVKRLIERFFSQPPSEAGSDG